MSGAATGGGGPRNSANGAYVSVFDRVRATRGLRDVGSLLNVAAGQSWRRLKVCPLCQGRDDFSYKAQAFKCWKCGEHGGVADLAAHLWGCSPFEAACQLLGVSVDDERKAYAAAHNGKQPIGGDVRREKPKLVVRPREGGDADRDDVLREIRREMRRATNSIVERYLVSRGLPASFERYVFFCPDAPYDVTALWGRGRRLPAMVCVVEVNGVPTGGLHLTYLRSDGRGKADTLGPKEPRKKMWGPQSRPGGGAPGGILLMKPRDATSVMCVAEGVENALSLAHVVGNGAGAFAAGSLDRLQGGMKQTPWGAVDWKTPAPDPKKPAATCAIEGPALIAVDSDMADLVINRGTRWEKTIPAARRAQVSGVLASHWWRAAGASDVQCVTPPAGKDINDLVTEHAA